MKVEYIVPGQWEDDDDGDWETFHLDEVKPMPLTRPATFVAPEPVRQPPAQLPTWVTTPTTIDVAPVWTPTDGARENTSAMDRAQALRVRLVPFLLAWGGVGVVFGAAVWLLAGTLPVGVLLAVLVFAGLTAVTYTRLNRTDYEYSREGTEQLRVVTAADLARQQMDHEHELKRMALGAYLATLDRQNGGGSK